MALLGKTNCFAGAAGAETGSNVQTEGGEDEDEAPGVLAAVVAGRGDLLDLKRVFGIKEMSIKHVMM